MRFWRLHIIPDHGATEYFDFRRPGDACYVGEGSHNHFSVHSHLIPKRLKLVSLGLRGLWLRLPEEVIPSLTGAVEQAANWKKLLYTGVVYKVSGHCRFRIADIQFAIEQVESQPLGFAPLRFDRVAMKQNFEAVIGSAAVHAAGVFLFALLSWISFSPSSTDLAEAELEMVPVGLVEAHKIFQPPPPVVEENPAESAEEPRPVKEMSKVAAAPSVKEAAGKAAGGNLRPKAQASKAPRDVNTMGLLAIQTSTGVSSVSVSSVRPKVVDPTVATDKALVANLGLSTTDFGFGTGGESGQSLAKLSALSARGYEGGLGEKVGRAAAQTDTRIRLVKKEVEVRGGLDPSIIRQIIEERLPEIRYCYEKALLERQNLKGKVAASWTINANGDVENLSSASEEMAQDILQPCMKQQIKNWKFPQPKGGGVVHVKYPFIFNPMGS